MLASVALTGLVMAELGFSVAAPEVLVDSVPSIAPLGVVPFLPNFINYHKMYCVFIKLTGGRQRHLCCFGRS